MVLDHVWTEEVANDIPFKQALQFTSVTGLLPRCCQRVTRRITIWCLSSCREVEPFFYHMRIIFFSSSCNVSWLINLLQERHPAGNWCVGGGKRWPWTWTERRRSQILVSHSVFFGMRLVSGLFGTKTLNASLLLTVKDEFPWQSNGLISAWWHTEWERHPAERFIEWWGNGAYTLRWDSVLYQ